MAWRALTLFTMRPICLSGATGLGGRRANRVTPRLALVLAGIAAALSLPGRAAEGTARSGTVELPPMLVEESVSTSPWYYVNAGGIEFLSRCSPYTTRSLVNAWIGKMQLVRALVPAEFMVRMDVPTIFVLYAQDLEQTLNPEIQRELQSGGGNIAHSMRLADRDMHASIAYIDEAQFNADGLSISPNHVRYLLDGRVPELPLWLIEGIERMLRGADFVEAPISLQPLNWLNQVESDALSWDATRPRAVLPARDLFASDLIRAGENRHARHAAMRASTEGLFLRWGVTSDEATRAAFWKFAARAAEVPVTEEMFESFFGFDYSELRDRLSDYLTKAVEKTDRIDAGRLPPVPDFELERATPNQIARVRGEWERLAIGHVQRRLPQVREPYIARARRTTRRAYDAGDRDPRLLATMGLCEIDAGNPAGALPFLEPAVATGVVRPRAYYELARLRMAELRRTAPEAKTFSFAEIAAVIHPLQRAVTQAPPLAETFALLGEAWAASEVPPSPAEFAELERGARLFARRPAVALPIARALARHGKNSEAAVVLDAIAGSPMTDGSQAELSRLRTELKTTLPRPAPGG